MSLRERVLQGGFYLMLRQGLSIGIGLVGMVILARLIGPANYGLFNGSLMILLLLAEVACLGVPVYLVRREEPPTEEVYHQAFSILLLSASVFVSLSLLASPVLARWVEDPRSVVALQGMALILPLTVLSRPAMARLERALDYRKVAGIELMGQLAYYALALPLAWRGFGVWAPIAGYALSQVWRLGATCGMAHYRPRWHWSRKLLREMVGYSLSYSASTWVWRLRTLVNPLVVGHYLGPEGVGYVALAIRLVEVLSFVKKATAQLSIAAFAKIQRDLPRLRRALQEAMGLQLLGLGPLFAGFALLAPWLIPLVYGEQWTPAVIIFPFIALSYLLNAVFSMHSSVLYVLRRNRAVVSFSSVHVALFGGAALLLVDRFGLLGYGLAEVVALGSYAIIHLQITRLFACDYSRALPWLLAFVPPLFFPLTGLPWGIGLWIFALGVLVLSRGAHAQIREYLTYLRRKFDGIRADA
jgi:O-antigen/teichoic acid export membrane protein